MGIIKLCSLVVAILASSSCSNSPEQGKPVRERLADQGYLLEKVIAETEQPLLPLDNIKTKYKDPSPEPSLLSFLRVKQPQSPDCNQERSCTDSNHVDINSQGDSDSDTSNTDGSERPSRIIEQNSSYPSQDLDLVQLPNEDSFQAVNKIYTSDLEDGPQLTQIAEYQNVKFNQLSSPDSLHTINATITDDITISGGLDQRFKFGKIEMIQRDSIGSVHSMNYAGDR